MNRHPYPAYKPSGIDWLGEIPKHWSCASLRWISRRYAGGTPDRNNLDFWTDGTIPWVNSGAVNQVLIKIPSAFITESALQSSNAKWVPKGALLMALAGQGKTKGMVAQTDIRVTCNQSMAAICPNEAIESRFLLQWLHSQYGNIRGLAGDEQRDGLNLEMIGSIPCPLPPIDEQHTIAAHLDRETARIDTLIAKKQKQIELLQEKRTALISHAVTKGLNPNAKMKDSGVEWLGEIPAHWELRKLQFIAEQVSEKVEIVSDNINYMGLENIESWTGKLVESELATEGTASRFRKNDILFGKLRPYLAKVYLAEDKGFCSTEALVLRTSSQNSRFLFYFLLSRMFIDLVNSSVYGAKMPRASWDFIGSQILPIPPPSEQHTIAAHLNRETAHIDTLTEKIENSITLLREYRTALISAAVTGKIDLRKEAA